MIKVNQILAADLSEKKNIPSAATYSAASRKGAATGHYQVPRSATSNTYSNLQGTGNVAVQGQQVGSHSNHSTKRDSYNFVSQQKQSMNSQEKLRRNLSREYCPMIIKSTNKNL